jgi:hypothetical protein
LALLEAGFSERAGNRVNQWVRHEDAWMRVVLVVAPDAMIVITVI